ncbi:MAG TPA: SGNH/GDSL hydrolase family protein [Polyangia bacterium]
MPVPPTMAVTPTVPTATPSPAPSLTPTGPTPTATLDTRLDPARWSQWPVIPTISAVAKDIFKRGLALGANPQVYSTIGDCQSEPDVFLGIYATDRYWLGDNYQYLQQTIDFYKNSFAVQSLAVRNGLSAPSALDPLWSYAGKCNPNEGPVACDLRVHKPSVVFINLGTNWLPTASSAAYEKYLRQIVDMVIAAGALPVLSTKADNVEGGNRINQVTAQVAHDYDIPLWNLWLGVQDLPHGGLDPARKDVYLTTEAWDRRNFTALEVLDRLRNELRPIYDASQTQ